jgi:hypothetical protein
MTRGELPDAKDQVASLYFSWTISRPGISRITKWFGSPKSGTHSLKHDILKVMFGDPHAACFVFT